MTVGISESPDAGEWITLKTKPWPLHWFTPSDLMCKGSKSLLAPLGSLQKLDMTRHLFKEQMIIVSAYRSKAHNRAVGGSPDSFHLRGRAFDIRWGYLLGPDKERLVMCAKQAGFTGFGFYHSFIHMDDGPKRFWLG